MKLDHVVFKDPISLPWQESTASSAKAGEYREASKDRPAEIVTITANEGWVFLRHKFGDRLMQRCVPCSQVKFATPAAEEQRK